MATSTTDKLPLSTDLDGTLINTDLLLEMVIILARTAPAKLLLLPWHLLSGRAAFKQWLARQVPLNSSQLPFNRKLLRYLRRQHESGRKIILATAANEQAAHNIALHIGIFSDVLASSDNVNLKGKYKEALLIQKFGVKGFVHAGDAPSDQKIWRSAAAAIPVNVSPAFHDKLKRQLPIEYSIVRPPVTARTLSRQFRIRHWIKNILVIVPVIAAHQLNSLATLWPVALSFFSLSFLASAFYVFNDMLDLPADRTHPVKKNRPLASNLISLHTAALLFIILILAASVTALPIPAIYPWLLLYSLTALLYTTFLKRIFMIDIIILSSFYLIRLFTGAAAAGISVSIWLLLTATTFLISLSCAKRYIDIKQKPLSQKHASRHTSPLLLTGIASGLALFPVIAFYILSTEARQLYSNPRVLWMLIPVCALGLGRIWYLAAARKVSDDPLLLAWRDAPSHLILFTFAAILFLAA